MRAEVCQAVSVDLSFFMNPILTMVHLCRGVKVTQYLNDGISDTRHLRNVVSVIAENWNSLERQAMFIQISELRKKFLLPEYKNINLMPRKVSFIVNTKM